MQFRIIADESPEKLTDLPAWGMRVKGVRKVDEDYMEYTVGDLNIYGGDARLWVNEFISSIEANPSVLYVEVE